MCRRSAVRLAKHEGPGPEVVPEIPVAPIAELFPQREDLGQALLDVAEDRRESLLLHHVWGFTFREIGDMLGISERAAKLQAFRGMQGLRQIFGADRVPARERPIPICRIVYD